MTLHPNAKLTPYTRSLMVERVLELGWKPADAAQAAGVSVRTLWCWVRRAREAGRFADRPSRPHRVPRRTGAGRTRKIERLRRRRLTGPAIARRLRMPRSTVAAVLKRLDLPRLRNLEPKPPPRRYERQRAGIDDHSRVGCVEILADEKAQTVTAFLRRVVAWFRRRGIRIEGVLTDNGSGYCSKLFAAVCAELGIRHLFTRPYTPRTNGKAERFIQTMLREWAYARPYRTSNQRTRRLPAWLEHYNGHRPHTALGYRPPISRLRRSR